eukprot:TRINITY_DN1452_c0_g3_i1.p1 TRINITY_DN1452_c0_g3~~TRINITY_DN1452_c0_g3_i1.p1  ORF type:complete len:155 (-),score=30.07 TRINITY_DN1452_c0_g3_i1:147-611(-)
MGNRIRNMQHFYKRSWALATRSGVTTTFARRFAVNTGNGEGQPNGAKNGNEYPRPPNYDPMEYEPFKFDVERQSLGIGYTTEELYGKRFGMRYSTSVERETIKDTIMFYVVVFGTLFGLMLSRDSVLQEEDAFLTYLHSNMQNNRFKREEFKNQ